MREIICTVKRSRGSKRRPKVMTAIARTQLVVLDIRLLLPSKKEVRVLSTPILSTRVPSKNSVRATASSSPSFLSSSNSKLSRCPVGGVGICRWSVCSTAAPPHSENVTTGIKMPYTPSVHKYKPFYILFQMEYSIQMYVDIV